LLNISKTTCIRRSFKKTKLFLRGMRHLHIRMRRLLLDERKAPIQQYDRCPDFYSMPAVETVPPGSNSTASSYSDKAIAALGHSSVQQRPSLYTDITGAKISSPSLDSPYVRINFPSNHAANQNSHSQETCSQSMNHNLSLQNLSSLTMQQLSSNLLPMVPEMSQVNTRQCILNTSSLGMAHGDVLLEARRSQSDALPRQDSFVSQNMTAAKTAGSFQLQTSATSNRTDPLVATLANIILPRARSSGLPRNNGELVDMLIREWHDSPSCGRENEHEILLKLLAGRSQRLQQDPITSNGHRKNAAFGSSTSLLGSQSSPRSFSVDANGVAKGKKKTWLGLIGHLPIQNLATSPSRGAGTGESIVNHDSAEQKPQRSKKSLRCGHSKFAGRKEFSPTEGRQRP